MEQQPRTGDGQTDMTTNTHTHRQRYRLVTTEMVGIQPISHTKTMKETCLRMMLMRFPTFNEFSETSTAC